MAEPSYVREADRVPEGGTAERPTVDFSAVLGTWTNTWEESRGIVKVVLAERDGRLVVRAFGAGSPEPYDWGETVAETLYSDGLSGRRCTAFTARYDFGFLESHLQANFNQGLLILASFNRFRDGSGRSDYFSREFYHR